VAMKGGAINGKLFNPTNLIFDQQGNLIFTDQSNGRDVVKLMLIRECITTIAGGGDLNSGIGDNGPANKAFLTQLILPSTSQVIVYRRPDRQRIRKVSNGIITTIAGGGDSANGIGDDAPATSAVIDPAGLAIDEAGNLYISDRTNGRVRRVSLSSG